MRSRITLVLFVLLVGLGADDRADVARAPLPAGLVAPDAKVASAAAVAFLEGPAVDEKDNVYFSDIIGKPIPTQSGNGIDREDPVPLAAACVECGVGNSRTDHPAEGTGQALR